MNEKLKEFITDNYEEELNEEYHSDHETCKDEVCLDEGGGVVSADDYEYTDEMIKRVYEKNRDDIDKDFEDE